MLQVNYMGMGTRYSHRCRYGDDFYPQQVCVCVFQWEYLAIVGVGGARETDEYALVAISSYDEVAVAPCTESPWQLYVGKFNYLAWPII